MKQYWAIFKAEVMRIVSYRGSVFFNSIGNIVYIVIIYFLWRSIYSGAEKINGMTFQQTFLYLALASTIFNIFKTWTEWKIANSVISGGIQRDLARPLDFQMRMLSDASAFVLVNMLLIGVPVIAVMAVFVSSDAITFNHIIYAVIAVFMAYIISFQIDYLTGLNAFYTESIWGISLTKESIVLLLSGAIVPIAFFPESMKVALMYLPFQYIYHVPLTMLTSDNISASYCHKAIFLQAIWVFLLLILSKLYYLIAVRQVTVNGG